MAWLNRHSFVFCFVFVFYVDVFWVGYIDFLPLQNNRFLANTLYSFMAVRRDVTLLVVPDLLF